MKTNNLQDYAKEFSLIESVMPKEAIKTKTKNTTHKKQTKSLLTDDIQKSLSIRQQERQKSLEVSSDGRYYPFDLPIDDISLYDPEHFKCESPIREFWDNKELLDANIDPNICPYYSGKNKCDNKCSFCEYRR